MEDRSPFNVIRLLIKAAIGVVVLYVAYLLFKYAAARGDWAFIADPIKNLFNSAR